MMNRSTRDGHNPHHIVTFSSSISEPLADSKMSRKYPGASTPLSISPAHPENASSIQEKKSNMKLPVGHLTNLDVLKSRSQNPHRKCDDNEETLHYQNVTVRGNIHDHTTGLSPIPLNESQIPIQFTDIRKGRRLDLDESSIPNGSHQQGSSNGKDGFFKDPSLSFIRGRSKDSKSSNSSVFPYPNYLENEAIHDSGEMLCTSLKILTMLKKAEKENQRISGHCKRKEKDKPDDQGLSVEFTPDMFDSVNSDAFMQVVYLLLSSFDAKEAEVRFRDCWPVYESKLIGAFRRVVLEWIKELIQGYPDFFPDFRLEALSGLLVNPGGERFILMMRQLCRLVMFKVANQGKDVMREQVLLPPTPTSDPEITNRQIHLLHTMQNKLFHEAKNKYFLMLKCHKAAKRRIRIIDDFLQHNEDYESLLSSRVEAYMKMNPEIFGDLTTEDWNERKSVVSTAPLLDLINDTAQYDTVRMRLENELKKRVEEVYNPISHLHNIMEDYGNVWHILDMDRTNLPVMDFSQIRSEQLMDEHGAPSCHAFIKFLSNTTNRIFEDEVLNSEVPPDILSEFKNATLRLDFLVMLEGKIKKQAVSPKLIEIYTKQRDELKQKYDGYEWTFLSGVQEPEFGNIFELSPIRVLDINRRTGRTPAIHQFLDSSSSTSSGENQASIKKRMSANTSNLGNKRKLDLMRKSFNGAYSRSLHASDGPFPLPGHLARPLSSLCISGNSTPVSSHPTSSRKSSMLNSLNDSSDTPKSSVRVSISFAASLVCDTSVNLPETGTTDDRNCSDVDSANTSRLSAPCASDNQNISTVSDSDEPVVSASVMERLQKLLETVSSSSSPRTCFNPTLNDSAQNRSFGDKPLGGISFEDSNKQKVISDVPNNDEPLLQEEEYASLASSFENISMTNDLVDVKGIMETSHIDMLLNSDSDD